MKNHQTFAETLAQFERDLKAQNEEWELVQDQLRSLDSEALIAVAPRLLEELSDVCDVRPTPARPPIGLRA